MLKAASPEPDTDSALSIMPSVVSRVSRFSYGVEWGHRLSKVSPPVDRAKDTFYFDYDGEELVDRLCWYLKRVSLF